MLLQKKMVPIYIFRIYGYHTIIIGIWFPKFVKTRRAEDDYFSVLLVRRLKQNFIQLFDHNENCVLGDGFPRASWLPSQPAMQLRMVPRTLHTTP